MNYAAVHQASYTIMVIYQVLIILNPLAIENYPENGWNAQTVAQKNIDLTTDSQLFTAVPAASPRRIQGAV